MRLGADRDSPSYIWRLKTALTYRTLPSVCNQMGGTYSDLGAPSLFDAEKFD